MNLSKTTDLLGAMKKARAEAAKRLEDALCAVEKIDAAIRVLSDDGVKPKAKAKPAKATPTKAVAKKVVPVAKRRTRRRVRLADGSNFKARVLAVLTTAKTEKVGPLGLMGVCSKVRKAYPDMKNRRLSNLRDNVAPALSLLFKEGAIVRGGEHGGGTGRNGYYYEAK